MRTELERIAPICAFAFLCAVIAIATLLARPTAAWAGTVQFENGNTATENAAGVITGTCSTVVNFVPLSLDDVDHFDVFMPDGQIVWGDCLDHGLVAPVNGTYSFVATPTGGGSYGVIVESGNAGYGVHIDGSTVRANRTQRVGYITWTPRIVRKGGIELAKSSSLPAITDGNDRYSLQGAVYGVYASHAAAAAGNPEDALATYTTDSDGAWSSGDEFDPGTYYIRELEAPEGYRLDDGVKDVVVAAGETTHVDAADTPIAPPDVEAQKRDDALSAATAQGDATLSGAEVTFRFYAGQRDAAHLPDSPTRTWVMKTDGQGTASLSAGEQMKVAGDEFYRDASGNVVVPLGILAATETKPPTGYLLGQGPASIVSIDPDIADATALIPETVERGNVSLVKADHDSGLASPQGDATLAGATYEIVNRSQAAVSSPQTGADVMPGEVVCTITTGADGRASTNAPNLNGWAIPDSFNGKALAYGTYEIREANTTEYGYLANESWSSTFSVRADGQLVTIATDDAVMRGGITVGKVSRDNDMHLSQGAADLAGWSFEIVNRSAEPVVVDGARFDVGETVKTIETQGGDGAYVASTDARCLPFGTYEVREIATMRPQDNGYLFDEASQAWSRIVSIRAQGEVVDLTDPQSACANQVVRGDLELVKAKHPGMDRLAGVPFKVTSTTTGEWHVIVTDRNGQASTSSAMNPHSANTNINDGALRDDGTVDEAALDDEAGVWFDGRTDAPTSPSDDMGALPFDTYTLEELGVEANAGLDLITLEATVYRDGAVIDLGTLDDTAGVMPCIGTTLEDANGNKVVAPEPNALLVDTVAYDNLDIAESYTLSGELWTVEDGQALDLIAADSLVFSPDLPHGSVDMAFEIDTTALEGRSIVCFEYLADAAGNEIASHADAEDEGQTVSVPHIATSLADTATGTQNATFANVGSFELTDTVSYAGLAPNRTYTVTGTLQDKETGAPVLDADGAHVTASRTFTPRSSEGSIDIVFSFSQPNAIGSTLVAFESLTCNGIAYAVHADIDDEAQTVWVPSVSTAFGDSSTGSSTIPRAEDVTLVDIVTFENLACGRAYTAQATLMDVETGLPVGDGVDDGDAGAFTQRVEFTPESPNGAVEVEFALDAEALPERTVCFERIYDSSGRLAAVHEDLHYEGQTVEKETPIEPPADEEPDAPDTETPAPKDNTPIEKPPKPNPASILTKTGDTLPTVLLVFVAAGALGLALAALSVRRLQRTMSITIERGKPQHMKK
ncbi:MAG: VaFE repeat-containing surface-anchored protein [Eggerthellaceae bacterium]|nr:VaFE repeat-containing surface-anchored protein [Eggerthellaceae bacterium]